MTRIVDYHGESYEDGDFDCRLEVEVEERVWFFFKRRRTILAFRHREHRYPAYVSQLCHSCSLAWYQRNGRVLYVVDDVDTLKAALEKWREDYAARLQREKIETIELSPPYEASIKNEIYELELQRVRAAQKTTA